MTVAAQSRVRAKESIRQLAASACHTLLRLTSKPYQLTDAPSVVIAPHQDDETLACGGLIARKRHEGLPVHVIFITDGSASHSGHSRYNPAAIAELRRLEAMQAMACLGVERHAVHFLDEPDGTLKGITPPRREDLVTRLADRLRAIAPGEVFLPCQHDGSSEHDAAFSFVTAEVARAGLQTEIWQYPVWSWWNPVLLLRCRLANRHCRRQPLEDFVLAKHRAIQCYQSQIAPLAPDTTPALPPGLIEIFRTNTEFFFRYEAAPPVA